MTLPGRPIPWRSRRGPTESAGGDAPAPSHPPPQSPSPDVHRLVRTLERKQRPTSRLPGISANGSGACYLERATYVSFRLDGLQVTEGEVRQALARGAASRTCRSRSAQRARNHVAILRRIESLLRRGRPLRPADVIRWYTSIACGLSSGRIDDHAAARVDHIVDAVNSPQLRVWPAVQEVTALHVRLLTDPFVPGFNGILARLLLRYHLGRCALPPVLFDPEADGPRLTDPSLLIPRLLELILESYERGMTR